MCFFLSSFLLLPLWFRFHNSESHGLDETLIQHCIRSKQKTKTPCISATHSSSQSSSLAGEPVDVKVEITPPRDAESVQVPNSYSIDSAPTNLGLSLSDFKTTSPQQRKLSELPTDTLLNAAANFGRLTPSPSSASSCKLYKKFEDFLDLSSPYNHYRCLSPSESNLTQCHAEGKYIYGVSKLDNKPGSSRLLRRQFSLDKDDCQNNGGAGGGSSSQKTSLDVPLLQDMRSSPSPTNIKPGRLHKQNSASVAQDLGKIEEIPASPTSCIFNYRSTHLSQIPGSAAGSPASKKPNETQNTNQISTIATLEIPTSMLTSDIASRAVSPISANTICSNSGDSISEQSNNNNGNICFHI